MNYKELKPAGRRCRVNVTFETLTKVDQHWAVQAVGGSGASPAKSVRASGEILDQTIEG